MKKRKNIAITINSLGPGGSEKQSLLLAKALKPYHNTLLIILSPNEVHPPRMRFIEESELEHIFLSNNLLNRAFQLYRIFRKNKIEFSFSFLPADTVLAAICGKLAGVAHRFGGIRNSYHPWLKLAVLRAVNNHILTYTIANNYSAYKSSIEFGFREKVFVVHNGIEIQPKPERTISASNSISIVSVGRLVAQKNYQTALQSVALLKSRLKNEIKIDYKIVGQGPLQEPIMKLIEKYQLQSEVELISDPGHIYPILASSHIYLSTSDFEGLSNAIMEAMNCALPILATDVGDTNKLVIHEKTGYLTHPKDPNAISAYLHKLVSSADIRHQMGNEGYAHLVKNFSYDTFKNTYLKIIAEPERIHMVDGNLIINKIEP